MAAILQTGVGNIETAKSNSANNLTVTRPSNTTVGDLLIAHVMFRNTGNSINVPTGWTMIGSAESAAASQAVLYRKITTMTGEPASYNFTPTGGGSSRCIIILSRVTGVNLDNPIQTDGSWATAITIDTLINLASQSPLADGLGVVCLQSHSSGSTSPSANYPSPWSGAASVAVDSGNSALFLGRANLSAGATGGFQFSVSGGQNSGAGKFFVLNPLIEVNDGPTLVANKTTAYAGEVVTLTATDPEDDTIYWSQSGTAVNLTGTGNSRQFTAPPLVGGGSVTIEIEDDHENEDSEVITIKPTGLMVDIGSGMVSAYRVIIE